MDAALLLTLLAGPSLASAPAAAAPEPPPDAAVVAADEFGDRLKAAGDDVEQLWALYEWTQEDKKRNRYAKRVLNKLLKVDPDHDGAHTALGHVKFDDQWFKSERELAAYKKKRAKELGLVEWEGEWVDPADLPYLKKGLKKDRFGRWYDPEVKKRLDEGWVQQDLVWVSPDEKDNIEKGLWKCGERWLSLDDANEFHQYLGSPWVIPGKRAVVWSFAERAVAEKALAITEQAYFDATKATGYSLEQPVHLAIARDQEQFLRFCDGDEELEHPQLEPRALSSQMRAAFADLWFDFEEERYRGMGATFWDPGAEHAEAYAIHDVRMAYGLSFMEFIDPASEAIEEVLAEGEVDQRFALDRLENRMLPEWIHWGVASYVSRWFMDTSVGQGGNPLWAREWSAQNIQNKGGLDDLGDVMDLPISADNNDTSKLVNEAGLLVAFCVDGGDVETTQLWNAIFETLRKGEDPANEVSDLRRRLLKNEDAVRTFAKL